MISSLFLGYARRYFVRFLRINYGLFRRGRKRRRPSSPSHPTRPLRSVSSPCLKPCLGTSSLGLSQTSSRRRSCCATTSAMWADRMQCAAQRCCAQILSYMTERVMTFRCLCVQRVLKVGIISGNFSLFFSRGYFSNNLEKSTAEPTKITRDIQLGTFSSYFC